MWRRCLNCPFYRTGSAQQHFVHITLYVLKSMATTNGIFFYFDKNLFNEVLMASTNKGFGMIKPHC
jgi:hypothetical protein